MKFPFPVLLCDIGGTNVRFAVQPHEDAPIEHGPHFKTKDYPGLESVAAILFRGLPAKPRSMIVCAAGPISGRTVELTNADWVIDGARLAAEAGLEQGLLLNDFEAQALSLPVLRPEWTAPIGAATITGEGVQLIMGLGTGLGTAALALIESRYLALASEAGHMDLGPVGAEETAIWPHLDTTLHGRVCVESILSGPGLMKLHRARCSASGTTEPKFDEVALIEMALMDPQGEEAQTLRLVWRLVARVSSDLALAFLAKGGVIFSGGVLPRLLPFLDPQAFRVRFEDKAPYGALLRGIGTGLITTEDFVLAGMARIAAAPQDYAIDYTVRAWR